MANPFTALVSPRVSSVEGLARAPAIDARTPGTSARLRHRAAVRVSHWLIALSVLGLLVTGTGILISHPRLYWGETGGVDTPSLVNIPLPMIIGPSVWNRPIHFLFAWILLFAWVAYVAAGLVTRHLRDDLLPEKRDLKWQRIWSVMSEHLRWKRTSTDDAWIYNVVQRLVYLGVIFLLFPAIVWTGLAMSFAVSSVFPFLATSVGGFQSVRTLHFVFVNLLLLFIAVHLAMLVLVGFKNHVRAMITGRIPRERGSEP
jgi:thiosulfate reductase cytochrome b subunit